MPLAWPLSAELQPSADLTTNLPNHLRTLSSRPMTGRVMPGHTDDPACWSQMLRLFSAWAMGSSWTPHGSNGSESHMLVSAGHARSTLNSSTRRWNRKCAMIIGRQMKSEARWRSRRQALHGLFATHQPITSTHLVSLSRMWGWACLKEGNRTFLAFFHLCPCVCHSEEDAWKSAPLSWEKQGCHCC